MGFKTLPKSEKRVDLHCTIHPITKEVLEKIATEKKIPVSRVLDRMASWCRQHPDMYS